MTDAPVGEDPDDTRPALDLLVEPLLRVGAPDPGGVDLGECEVGEEVGLGLREQLRHARVRPRHAVDHPVELLAGGRAVGLLEHAPDGRGDHAPGRARDEVLGVAREVHPAALPARAQELLVDRLDEARVVVRLRPSADGV
jgi:hypothetical protein